MHGCLWELTESASWPPLQRFYRLSTGQNESKRSAIFPPESDACMSGLPSPPSAQIHGEQVFENLVFDENSHSVRGNIHGDLYLVSMQIGGNFLVTTPSRVPNFLFLRIHFGTCMQNIEQGRSVCKQGVRKRIVQGSILSRHRSREIN